MILADTSVWIDHLRLSNPDMEMRLMDAQILMHPLVIAEIALGSMKNRRQKLDEMDSLFEANVAQLSEIRHTIETLALYSKGIGLVDVHLIASCLLTPGTRLWTKDVALRKVAEYLGILFEPL